MRICTHTHTQIDPHENINGEIYTLLCGRGATTIVTLVSMLHEHSPVRTVLSLHVHILLYIELSVLIPLTSLAGTCFVLHTHTEEKALEPQMNIVMTQKEAETIFKKLCESRPCSACANHTSED